MPKLLSEDRCQFIRAEGKRCRMPRSRTHPSLCAHHARQRERQSSLSALASSADTPNSATALDLLGPVHDFRSAAAVNHVLGKLLVLHAAGRISPRSAAVTGYLCQLLLQSLDEVKNEIWNLRTFNDENSPELNQALQQICNIAPPPRPANSERVPPVAPPAVPPVHAARSESAPLPHQQESHPVPPVATPAHPPKPQPVPPAQAAKSESAPPAAATAHPTKTQVAPPPPPEKSDPVPPAAPPAPPPKPQPFGRAVHPPARMARFRYYDLYR